MVGHHQKASELRPEHDVKLLFFLLNCLQYSVIMFVQQEWPVVYTYVVERAMSVVLAIGTCTDVWLQTFVKHHLIMNKIHNQAIAAGAWLRLNLNYNCEVDLATRVVKGQTLPESVTWPFKWIKERSEKELQFIAASAVSIECHLAQMIDSAQDNINDGERIRLDDALEIFKERELLEGLCSLLATTEIASEVAEIGNLADDWGDWYAKEVEMGMDPDTPFSGIEFMRRVATYDPTAWWIRLVNHKPQKNIFGYFDEIDPDTAPFWSKGSAPESY